MLHLAQSEHLAKQQKTLQSIQSGTNTVNILYHTKKFCFLFYSIFPGRKKLAWLGAETGGDACGKGRKGQERHSYCLRRGRMIIWIIYQYIYRTPNREFYYLCLQLRE